MVFIWKGIGILVPIVIVGIGYLSSLFYEDRRLGNTDLMGWALLWSSIVLILVGVPISTKSKREGTKSDLWQHTFFFIPILFWGILSLILSVYFLLIYSPNKSNIPLTSGELAEYEAMEENGTTVHFYNPTSDSLYYYFSDQYGTDEKVKLADYENDYQIASGKEDQAGLIGAMTFDGETRLFIIAEDPKNFDKNRFIPVMENGKEILLRKIPLPTKETNDCDDIWVLLDREFSLALIDISSLYINGKFDQNQVKKTNWTSKIVEKHSGNDIIKLNVKHPGKNGTVEVINPNSPIPMEMYTSTKIYFLAEFWEEEELSNEYLSSEIKRLTSLE